MICSIVGIIIFYSSWRPWWVSYHYSFPSTPSACSTCGLNYSAWENLAERATKINQMGRDMVMTSSEDWSTSSTTCTTLVVWCVILSGYYFLRCEQGHFCPERCASGVSPCLADTSQRMEPRESLRPHSLKFVQQTITVLESMTDEFLWIEDVVNNHQIDLDGEGLYRHCRMIG